MEQFSPSDMKTILHSKRANMYYLEYCRVMQKDGRVLYLTESQKENQYFNIPIANTTVLLLGNGTSINGFTKKDFMARYTSGEKKKIWGNPYIRKERIKGIGEVTSLMEKAGGTLNIELDIDREAAKDLDEKIKNAGVSSFYLGKKGLAYVSDIRI